MWSSIIIMLLSWSTIYPPLDESMKIHFFEDGIKDQTFDSVKITILVDRQKFYDFDYVMQLYDVQLRWRRRRNYYWRLSDSAKMETLAYWRRINTWRKWHLPWENGNIIGYWLYRPVIGHGIGGKHIPAKMAQLAESQSLE